MANGSAGSRRLGMQQRVSRARRCGAGIAARASSATAASRSASPPNESPSPRRRSCGEHAEPVPTADLGAGLPERRLAGAGLTREDEAARDSLATNVRKSCELRSPLDHVCARPRDSSAPCTASSGGDSTGRDAYKTLLQKASVELDRVEVVRKPVEHGGVARAR